MKLLAGLILSLSLSVYAQEPLDPVDPVSSVQSLYKGCIEGMLKSERPESLAAVVPFIEDLDEQCIVWTVIWYTSTGDDIRKWPKSQLQRFENYRENIILQMMREFPLQFPVRPKAGAKRQLPAQSRPL